MSVKDPPLPLVHLEPIQHAWAHREWGWADEQTWSRLYHIPMGKGVGPSAWTRQNSGDPVLSPTVAAWDSKSVSYPSVVKIGSTYYMAYTGESPTANSQRIGIAKSTDKINWTKSGDNPIITVSVSGWKDQRVNAPNLVVDYVDNLLKMWYWGQDTGGASYGIGYAYCSLDNDPMVGANWTDYASNPVISNVYNPYGVLRLGGAYYMMVNGGNCLDLYVSGDGLSWTKVDTVINLGSAGAWDDTYINYATLFWNIGVFYLLYAGWHTAYQIGMAVSSGDGTTYKKLFNDLGNPVFTKGASGKFDQTHVFSPTLIMEDKSFWMWYVGGDGTNYEIGLAKLDLDY